MEELIKNTNDVCLLSETKIDGTFPNQLCNISNYRTLPRDRNKPVDVFLLLLLLFKNYKFAGKSMPL